MLTVLFHIPSRIAGVPLFGAGLLLWIWLAIAAGWILWLARKQGLSGDTLSYLPLALIVAAVIVWVLPAISDPLGVPIRGYGVMMLLAVVLSTLVAVYRARRAGLDPDIIYSLAFWMFVPGILGARLFHVVEYWDVSYAPAFRGEGFWAGLTSIFKLTEGGLVVYGAFFGGLLGLLAFVWRRKIPLLPLCDLIAPSLILGQSIGRVGCFLNGCCFGGACDLPWSVTFPPGSPPYMARVENGQSLGFRIADNLRASPVNVLDVTPRSPAAAAGVAVGDRITAIENDDDLRIVNAWDAHAILSRLALSKSAVKMTLEDAQGHEKRAYFPASTWPPRSPPLHPAQLYSSFDALLLFFLLLAYEPFARRDGEIFALLITIHPIARFLLEAIRVDEAPVFGTGLSISQNVSVLILLAAAGLWAYVLARPPGRVWFHNAA